MAVEKISSLSGEEAKRRVEEMGEPLIQISVYKDDGNETGIFVDSSENATEMLKEVLVFLLSEQFGMICIPKENCLGIAVFEEDYSNTDSIPQ